MLDIGITLRKYRDKNCYTQQFVADCIEISRVTYRKWENNNVDFTINHLKRIAVFYNIPIEQIIKESYVDNGTTRSKNQKGVYLKKLDCLLTL